MTRLLGQRRGTARRSTARTPHDEQGFTLVELIIVVTIMPLIVGAIAVGLVSVFSMQSATTTRLSGSGDLQTVNATFVKDVQSAETITTEASNPPACGVEGTQLLGLVWSTGQTAVSYVSVPVNNGTTNYSLERVYCTLGNFTTPALTTVISADLTANQASGNLASSNPVQICAPTYSSCSNTPVPPTSAATVAAVVFPLALPMTSAAYTMVASPRAGGTTAGGNPPPKTQRPPLLLLGTSCSSPVLSVGGSNNNTNGGLTINVNGGTGNGYLGVLANCSGSITLANGGNINAGAILTSSPTPIAISTSGNPGNYPPQYAWSLPPSDPFAGLVPPKIPASTDKGSCQYNKPQKTYTCSPGYYTSSNLPNFANNSIIIFSGNTDYTKANYYFSTDVALPNGSTTTFEQGAYIFGANDKGAFSTGTNGVTVYGNNALLYSPGGSLKFENNSNIQLTPPIDWYGSDGTAVTSQGVTVWDGATYNSSTGVGVVTLGNNATSTNVANAYGGIYAPNGLVVDSNNGTIDTSFIVANSASFANGLVVNITS